MSILPIGAIIEIRIFFKLSDADELNSIEMACDVK